MARAKPILRTFLMCASFRGGYTRERAGQRRFVARLFLTRRLAGGRAANVRAPEILHKNSVAARRRARRAEAVAHLVARRALDRAEVGEDRCVAVTTNPQASPVLA